MTESGTRIGRYVIGELLGAGGMGHVYRAHDVELDRAIAVKILRSELATSASSLVDRLVRESRMMAKIAHPAVITVHDVGRDGDTLFIAMELIRGETLGAWLARARPSWRDIVAVFERAASGLAAAHDAGIVHRDFKPDNVLLERTNGEIARVVVTDFGIARAASSGDERSSAPRLRTTADASVTATGAAVGTPAYMPPEQLAGDPVDLRADVFAFCAALWEALFGQRPFPGATVDEIRASMNHLPQRGPRRVPARLVRALERGMALARADRWSSIRDLGRELAAIRAVRRRTLTAAFALALAGVGTAGALALRRAPPVDPCSGPRDALARSYNPFRAAALRTKLAAQAWTIPIVVPALDGVVASWQHTHDSTCDAERVPAQAPLTAMCLDARRIEIDGFVDDSLADGVRAAGVLLLELGDPARCVTPSPGLLLASMPADPDLRRKVSAQRYAIAAAAELRDHGDLTRAAAMAAKAVEDTRTLWPFVHAEAAYVLSSIKRDGEPTSAFSVMRETAALAEAAHNDRVAASAWTLLVDTATFQQGDPARGFEYATYAEAAAERIGNPSFIACNLALSKGATLTQLDRLPEATVQLELAVTLARSLHPELLSMALQGLGILQERQGRTAEAIATYRAALAKVPDARRGETTLRIAVLQRISSALAELGNAAEAEPMAREAVATADQVLDRDSLLRITTHSNLAGVLQVLGQDDEALRIAHEVAEDFRRIQGERSEGYATTLASEGELLVAVHRFEDARVKLARACDALAFQSSEEGSGLASCWTSEAEALAGLHQYAAALEKLDRAVPVLVKTLGEEHPTVVEVYLQRAGVLAALGKRTAAITDLEKVVAFYTAHDVDQDNLARAELALGVILPSGDEARARILIERAQRVFVATPDAWEDERLRAHRWLLAHPPSR